MLIQTIVDYIACIACLFVCLFVCIFVSLFACCVGFSGFFYQFFFSGINSSKFILMKTSVVL